MGFGSYDESEQENRPDGSEIEIGDDTRENHDGGVEFEGMDDTDELISNLEEIKS